MVSTTYQLTMRSGPTPGKIFPLEKDELLMGRDMSSDIVINDAGVSRRHAHLVRQENGYLVEDLGSTNGTSVSGQRLMGPYQLHSGEAFTLGESVTLVYEAITYDPDATIASPRMAMPQSQPAPVDQAPYQPVQPVQQPVQPMQQPLQPMQQPVPPMPPQQMPSQPVTPPPPVYSAPAAPQQHPQQISQPSYAGQVPPGPVMAGAPAKKKGGFPVWLIIILIILVLMCVCVVGVGFYIDSHNLWCNVLPFIPGCQ